MEREKPLYDRDTKREGERKVSVKGEIQKESGLLEREIQRVR